MIVVIDNQDSFTYNIAHAFKHLGQAVEVVSSLGNLKPKAVVIGPGPGHPSAHSFPLLEIPTLGICLGHQWLGLHFGGTIARSTPTHGKASPIHHTATHLFKNLPQGFSAIRYHSLILQTLPPSLIKLAWTPAGEIMALAHRSHPYYGLQFHPDSIATEHGYALIEAFIASF